MTRSKWIGFVLGLGALVLFATLPPLDPITAKGMWVVGIVLFTIIWWITSPVPLPVTSVFCVSLLVLSGALARDEAFSKLGHYIIWFLIGVYGVAKALEISGFIKRFSLWVLTRGFIRGHPWVLVMMIILTIALTSTLITMLPAFILMTTMIVGILEQLGYSKGNKVAAALMMGMTWAVSFGSLMLPFSSPMSLLAIDWIAQDTGYQITFVQWGMVAIPAGLLGCLLIVLVLKLMRPNIQGLAERSGDYLIPEYQKLGSLKGEEKIAIAVYLAVVVMWILSSMSSFLPESISNFLTNNMGMAVPPLLGAGVLTLLRYRGQPLLTWPQWGKAVDWDTVLFVAAIFVIGGIVSNPDFGISAAMQKIFLPVSQGMSPPIFILFVVAWTVIQTNLMSNMVSMYVVYTPMLPIALEIGGINPVALGFLIRFGATMAFALPSATVVTAMVINQGWVTVKEMGLWGFLLAALVILTLSFPIYYFVSFVF